MGRMVIPLIEGDALVNVTNVAATWSYATVPGVTTPGVATDNRARILVYGINKSGETLIATIVLPPNGTGGSFVANKNVSSVFSSVIDGNYTAVACEVSNYNSSEGLGWNAAKCGFNLYNLKFFVTKQPVETAMQNSDTSSAVS